MNWCVNAANCNSLELNRSSMCDDHVQCHRKFINTSSHCFFVDCCWLIYCSDECGENRELNKKSFDKLMNSVSK